MISAESPQVEISLPDEHGRVQILKIHTASMREVTSQTTFQVALIPYLSAVPHTAGAAAGA